MSASSTKLIAFDVETTMRCKRDGFSSSTPWDISNEVILAGAAWRKHTGDIGSCWWTKEQDELGRDLVLKLQHRDYVPEKEPGVTYMICGHNLKFDLTYTRRDLPIFYFTFLDECPLWDTMIAEYILSAQRSQFVALSTLCEKYNTATKKGTYLDDLIKAGDTTEDADQAELSLYCMADCEATLEIAEKQMQRAYETGGDKLVQLILLHSNLTRVFSCIEANGMTLDHNRLYDASVKTAMKINDIVKEMVNKVHDLIASTQSEENTELIISNVQNHMNANAFWSALFFGGDFTIEGREQVGVYKSGPKKGEPRYRVSKTTLHFVPSADPSKCGTERTKLGGWSLDESVLKQIPLDAAQLLLEYRKYNKLMTTYLQNLPTKAWTGVVHPTINQTSTLTGRLSQTSPNLQNQSSEPIVKNLFIPPGEDLTFIEADYKQLEMVFFALLTKDPTLCEDLRAGFDIHSIIGTKLFGASFDEKLRRKVKGVNFGMIYGGGAVTLSKQVGLAEEIVRKIIQYFFNRYDTIRAYRSNRSAQLATSKLRFVEDGKHFVMEISDTGRRYAYELIKKVNPAGIAWEPQFTSMCNYPIQGMATGDAVPLMISHIWNRIREENMAITIHNTVHDSILFSVPTCQLERYGLWIKEELERMPELLTSVFGIDTLDLPMNVVVKYSKDSWAGPWHEITPF